MSATFEKDPSILICWGIKSTSHLSSDSQAKKNAWEPNASQRTLWDKSTRATCFAMHKSYLTRLDNALGNWKEWESKRPALYNENLSTHSCRASFISIQANSFRPLVYNPWSNISNFMYKNPKGCQLFCPISVPFGSQNVILSNFLLH